MGHPTVEEQVAKSSVGRVGPIRSSSIVAALTAGIAIIGLVFSREIQAAIEVWNQSTAYSHCYLVLPMALYLLWERKDVIARDRAEPDLRFTALALPLTAIWLIAERLGIMEARQLVVVAGVELLFLTVLGRRFFYSISGPLLYLFFLVPFGAFLTPALQQFTAAFSILGLDLLGIPNFSDKFTIETSAGVFFVAEACAGLRFLIAAIAFGVFYSLLSYTSITKRFAFIAASIIVPIIANGFRALGIVVLGEVLGSAEAAAADHIIYGWVFFSVVMLLLIAGGHAFRDVGQTSITENRRASAVPARSPLLSAVSVILGLCFGPAIAAAIDATLTSPVLSEIAIAAPAGCSLGPIPTATSADRRLFTFLCGRDRFEVSVQAFAARSTSSAMTTQRRRATQEIGAENAAVSTVDVPGEAGHWTIVQTTDPDRVTAYAAWVDGQPVSSGLAGRLAQARDSVLGATHAPALITVSAAEPPGRSPGQRKATLERLTSLLGAQGNLSARMAALTRIGN